MLEPFVFHDFSELNESGMLLPPVSMKPSKTASYAQSIPQDIDDPIFYTLAQWNKDTYKITCSNNPYTNTVVDCKAVDIAYDQLNRLSVMWVDDETLYLYWFDSFLATFVTSNFGVVTQAFFFMDDVRRLQQGSSTMMLFYVRDSVIYYRLQHDRFTIEHTVDTLEEDTYVRHIGLNDHYRIQITIGNVFSEVMLPQLIVVDDAYVAVNDYWVGDDQ